MTAKRVETIRVLKELQLDFHILAEDWEKRFYNTHGQVSHDTCYAKESAYRHAVSMITAKINALKHPRKESV